MKHSRSIPVLVSVLLVAACSSLAPNARPAASAEAKDDPESVPAPQSMYASGMRADRVMILDGAGTVLVQKVEFRPGVSTVNVERLARRFDCKGGVGAGLITEKGPVEVYRMQCDNGMTFLAKCELRQCRPMR